VRVEIARNLAEVESLRPAWSQWRTHRDSDLDYCREYVWKGKEFIRPHVIALYDGERPVSLLVGRIGKGRIGAKIGYAKIPFDAAKILYISYLGFLGNTTAENAQIAVKAVVESLERNEADAALSYEGADSAMNAAIRRLNPGEGSYCATPLQAHSMMSLHGGIDAVYARLSSGLRSELRRKTKKFASTYGTEVSVRSLKTFDDIKPFLADPRIEAMLRSVLAVAQVGAPETVKAGLEAFIAHHQPDELMVAAQVFDHEARKRSYELLAGL